VWHLLGVAKERDSTDGPQLLRCSPFHPHRSRLLRRINLSAVFRRQSWLRGLLGVSRSAFKTAGVATTRRSNSLSLCGFDDAHCGWCRKRSIPDIRRTLPRRDLLAPPTTSATVTATTAAAASFATVSDDGCDYASQAPCLR
jgi:hypothetical protein